MTARSILTLLSIVLCWGCQPKASSPAPSASKPPVNRPAPFGGVTAGEQRAIGDMQVCWCPAGSFLMGSPASERDHRGDESQVEVTLSQGFWMGQFEVTQGQWKETMGGIPGELIAGDGDDFPLYWINYGEAQEFCRKLTEQARAVRELPADWEFCLPTEAQWEYACRAGTTTAFSTGAELTKADANIDKPYDGKPTGAIGTAASQVGSYPPNAWKLYDMHGNEFEWCLDWYHAQLPGGVDPDLSKQQGSPNRDGTYSRVRRGGAWTDSPMYCRSALRLRYEPERRADHIGFRVAIIQR